MTESGARSSITLNDVPLTWDLARGELTFHGIQAALFWIDPSLTRLLTPLVQEVGAPIFRLAVAHHASLGTEEDYQIISAKTGADFDKVLPEWGRSVAVAGWGCIQLGWFDAEARRAVVRVRDPWELRVQRGAPERWGCPFLFGKLVGMFSHAIGVPSWAEEVESLGEDGVPTVDFHLRPAERTIFDELEALRGERDEEARRPLREKIDELTQVKRELSEKLALIERQQEAIRALSTPILQVWNGVLALPIIGAVDERRAADLTAGLLEAVSRQQARHVILDLTGVEVVDARTADLFARIMRAVSLLGAECLVCGIRPAVAQAMVATGAEASHAGAPEPRTFATMQAALQAVIGRPR